MSASWYLFTPPQVNLSGDEEDEFLDYAGDSFDEVLQTTFLGQDVVLYQNGTLDESTAIRTKAIVQGNVPIRQTQFKIRQILCYVNTLKIGNYVKYDGNYYLITELPGSDLIYDKGWMVACNYNLKWVNDDGDIIEYYCVFQDSTRYSSGESDNRYIVVGDTRLEILLPKNEETVKLNRERRFMIDDYQHAQVHDPLVYSITKINLVENSRGDNALFTYIVAETTFNPTKDSRELMIADYFNMSNKHSLEIITPEALEIAVGQLFQIQTAARINGEQVFDGVMYVSSDEGVVSISDGGLINGVSLGQAEIKITFNDIVKTISVNVADMQAQLPDSAKIIYSGDASLRVGGLPKAITANFFDGNGNLVDDDAVWTVLDESGISQPSCITIAAQGHNTIKLQCANDPGLIGRTIYLKLTGTQIISEDIAVIKLIGLT